jgi:UDP-glucose 4-epimerase
LNSGNYKLNFGRALVSGGAGFIGSHIVDRLIEHNCDVVVLDNFSSGTPENLKRNGFSARLTVIKGNINDRETVAKALKDVEVVFHEAAIVNIQRSIAEPEMNWHVNVRGTFQLLQFAINSGARRFIFASSAAVYGNTPVLPRREDTIPKPISPYGWSKLRAEEYCLEAYEKYGIGATALRYFNVYGPRSIGKPYSGVINKFAEKLVKKEAPVIFGNGKQSRDFIFVDDITTANILAANDRSASGEIFNVGTGMETTVENLALLESRILLGDNVVIPLDYRPDRKGDVKRSFADISLIGKKLGYSPAFSIEDGLTMYLQQLYPTIKSRN